MSWFQTEGIGIVGIAAAVPPHRFGRQEHLRYFDEKIVDKVIAKTGILESRRTDEAQTAGDLGCAAAEHLLSRLPVDRSGIGCLVFVTQSPDYRRPATSCVLQMRLGLPRDCAALDVGQGCAGFIYGQQIVQSLMGASDMKYGLLLLGETTSKVMSHHDHTSMMFGDAGAAILYERQEKARCQTVLRADGNGFKSIVLPAGGFREMNPGHEKYLCHDGIERTKYDFFMNGMDVLSFFITDVPKAVEEFFTRTHTVMEDYDLVAFHQANHFILKKLARSLSVPAEKMAISLDRYGNTSGVSIPLTLCDRYGSEDLGERNVLAAGFGVGFAWGVTSFVVDTNKIFPIIETDDYFREGKIDMTAL